MKQQEPKKKEGIFREFECPECTAHNPLDDGFTFNDEVFCMFCGQSFEVRKTDDDRFKLKLT